MDVGPETPTRRARNPHPRLFGVRKRDAMSSQRRVPENWPELSCLAVPSPHDSVRHSQCAPNQFRTNTNVDKAKCQRWRSDQSLTSSAKYSQDELVGSTEGFAPAPTGPRRRWDSRSRNEKVRGPAGAYGAPWAFPGGSLVTVRAFGNLTSFRVPSRIRRRKSGAQIDIGGHPLTAATRDELG